MRRDTGQPASERAKRKAENASKKEIRLTEDEKDARDALAQL